MILGKNHKTNSLNKCPLCKVKLDGATGINHGNRPKEGDVSICINCGAALIYKKDLQLRAANGNEITQIRKSPSFKQFCLIQSKIIERGRIE